MSDPIVGIDLGTSNSVVAYADAGGNVQVLADDASYKVHPSVVSFHPNGGVIVGAAAKQRKVIDPENTVYSAKRLIGRRFQSPEVQTAKTRMPYRIKEGAGHVPLIVTRAGEFAVTEISAIILEHLKTIASARIGEDIHRAVITVPASFNDAQRSATATAGSVAGLEVVRVLNEPTAAALAYGHARNLNQTIAVYDFGGGTFDVTILKLADQIYEVLGTAGDNFLGGDDLDECLVEKMVSKFFVENKVDLRTNEVAMMRLRAVAEQTKIELSRRSRAVVRIDEIGYGPKGAPLNLQIELTRDQLISDISSIVNRTFPVCDEALALAGIGIDAIDDILLVGGTTKVPYVRDQVSRFFNRAPRTDIAPEEAIAVGAALQATALQRAERSRPSSSMTVTEPVPDDEVEPPEPPVSRRTNPYARLATDTGYSVTRTGTRDDLGGDTLRDPVDRATPAQAVPLARLTQPMPRAPTFGQPARSPTDLDVTALEPSQLTLLPLPPSRITATASVPPAPRQTQGISVAPPPTPMRTSQLPPVSPTAASTMPLPPARPPSLSLDFDDDDAPMPPGTTPGVLAPGPAPFELSPASTNKGIVPPSPGPSPVILDVTPRSLGIATVAGFCEELIRRNSRVPAEMRKLFTTSRDSQDVVRIVICQGESRRLDNNTVIGDLMLQDLPPRARGETSIEVTFRLDASGILQVHARDAKTGKEQRTSLDLVGSMSDDEVSASRDRLQALRR